MFLTCYLTASCDSDHPVPDARESVLTPPADAVSEHASPDHPGGQMFHSTRSKAAWGAALAAVLLTAGCGGSDASDDAAYDPDAPVTINVGLFGTFGFKEAGLYDEYMKLHPNVTIEETSVEQAADFY
jgi:hypothetical protein